MANLHCDYFITIFCRTRYMLRQPRKSSLKIIVNTGLRILLLDYHNKSPKKFADPLRYVSRHATPIRGGGKCCVTTQLMAAREPGGMLVVSLRGKNQGCWSHLGCSGRNATISAKKVSLRVHSKKQKYEKRSYFRFRLNLHHFLKFFLPQAPFLNSGY